VITAIIDYGMGNSKSVSNMLRKIGAESIITTNPDDLQLAAKFIIPGVGSFDNAMTNLQQRGFIAPLNEYVIEKKVPVLGICLGMHLLAGKSEEGHLPGLDWIAGNVEKFNFTSLDLDETKLKIPHMGWNSVTPTQPELSIFTGVPQPMRFYFVHSYHFVCKNPENVLGTARYGYDFTCAVRKENIYGVQFHPEKSHKFGMQVLKNFVEMV
jgi:glutamine amidotransferase